MLRREPDIVALRGFYASPLGGALKARLRRRLGHYINKAEDEVVVGIGYATPFLRKFIDDISSRTQVLSLMPARQGAIYWPVNGNNLTALVESEQLPLRDNTVHRVLMIHALENEAYPADMLREAWRVLAPGGQLIIVAPRRYGLWRFMGETPWRGNASFRRHVLKEALRQVGFTWIHSEPLCVVPPSQHPMITRSFNWLDQALSFLAPILGSIVIIEAEKHIYASISEPAKLARKKRVATPVSVTTRNAS